MKGRFTVVLILFFGIVIRILYWVYSQPPVTCNMSYWGLMAKYIAAGRYFPFFRFGSGSTGTFISYVTAVFVPILGNFSIYFLELFFSALFIVSVYFTGKRFLGEKGGIISLVLASFAPSVIIKSAMYPTGVYNVILFFGSLLFLLTLKIWEGDSRIKLYSIFCLIGIICIWTSFYSICFLLPCILFLINRVEFKRKIIPLLLFLSLIVIFWFYSVTEYIICKPLEDIIFYSTKNIMSLPLNNMLSVKIFFNISTLLGVIYFLSFIYLCFKSGNRLLKSKNVLILFFLVISVSVITRIKVNPPLEFHPDIILYTVLPILAAYLLLDILKKSKRIFYISILFIVSLQLGDCGLTAFRERKENRAENDSLNMLVSQLKNNNIHYVYTTEELVPVINFLTKENTIAGYYDKCEYLPFTQFVYASGQPAVVLPFVDREKFANNLKYVCRGYKEENCGEYSLFHSFIQPVFKHEEILPIKWSAAANYNNENAFMAFDRDKTTRWITHVRKIPDMYFALDMGEYLFIDKIIIYYGEDIQDRPLGLRIEVSDDNKNWKEVVVLKNNKNVMFWSGPYLFWNNSKTRQEYYFQPVSARYIKLIQTGYDYDEYNYWSITELFVYSPVSELGKLDYDTSSLKSFLNQMNVKSIYSDYWLSAILDSACSFGYIDFKKDPTVITDRRNQIDNVLDNLGIVFKKNRKKDFISYSSFNKVELKIIDKEHYNIQSNVNTATLKTAFDNNFTTRWTTDKCQKPGFYFQIDLKDERSVSGIRLWHYGSPNDYPRNIKIEILNKNSIWQKVDYAEDWTNSLFWNGFTILIDSSKCRTYIFKTKETKAIRCTLEEKSDYHYWSIHEVEVLENLAE